jgi:hypothetical protein
MRVAKSAACLPDITLQDLGTLDLVGARRAFDNFPWADHLRKTIEMDAGGLNCVNPDITFGIAPAHITLKLNDDGVTFSVEVCVARVRKILGIFGGVQFYEVPSITAAECGRAIDMFFEASPGEQHAYFEQLRAGTPREHRSV